MTLPPSINGTHYRELSPNQGGRKWRWENLSWAWMELPVGCPDMIFHDAAGRTWGRIHEGKLGVAPRYQWNGASPKRHLPLIGWVGAVDTRTNLLATRNHDLLYQASDTAHFPLTRAEVDRWFFDTMVAADDCLADLYYSAVQAFGGRYWQRAGSLYSKLT